MHTIEVIRHHVGKLIIYRVNAALFYLTMFLNFTLQGQPFLFNKKDYTSNSQNTPAVFQKKKKPLAPKKCTRAQMCARLDGTKDRLEEENDASKNFDRVRNERTAR